MPALLSLYEREQRPRLFLTRLRMKVDEVWESTQEWTVLQENIIKRGKRRGLGMLLRKVRVDFSFKFSVNLSRHILNK